MKTSVNLKANDTESFPLPAPPALSKLPSPSLFLDFDGTLVELAGHPDDIRPDRRLPDLLSQLADRFEGRVAVVSGRTVEDLDRHLGRVPVAVAGSHGGELRAAGSDAVELRAESIGPDAETAARCLVDAHPGLVLERKRLGFALHYRAVPELEDLVVNFAQELMQRHRLTTQSGKMVIEFMPEGFDKGQAVAWFLARAPFKGSVPVFLGDDVTDEHGFEVAGAQGGLGILVGEKRPTQATARLSSVAQVQSWLWDAVT